LKAPVLKGEGDGITPSLGVFICALFWRFFGIFASSRHRSSRCVRCQFRCQLSR